MTALMWATFHGHLGIAQRLLDAGAEVNHADIVRDTTPLALSHTAPPFSALVPHTAPPSPPRFALTLHTSRGCETDEEVASPTTARARALSRPPRHGIHRLARSP